MDRLLLKIKSPDSSELSPAQLEELAVEMREAVCRVAGKRIAHPRKRPKVPSPR